MLSPVNELHPLWMKNGYDEKLHIMDENICSCMTCIHDYVDNDGEDVICESS